MNSDNRYNISPPFRFFNWIVEAFFLIMDKPVFWLLYALMNAIVFSLSSNIVYLHLIGILSSIITVNIARQEYTGKKNLIDKSCVIKHAMLIFNLLFFAIVVRYIFWLFSASFTIFDDIKAWGIEDYMNPIQMIISGLAETNLDLFLFNFLVMPFHYIQMTFYTTFFCAAVFFYPLFIWKNNSAIFSYRLNLRVILHNMGNVACILLTIVLLSLVVFLYSVAAFPYLYVFTSVIIYAMWADIFNEQKKQIIKPTPFELPPIMQPPGTVLRK